MKEFTTKYSKWIFLALLLLIMLVYNYHQILSRPPGVIHQWRQCDGLSFATNYYYEGFNLFNPSIHWSGLDGTGKATSEFPIVYYIVALIWKVTGKYELVFRIVNLLIFITGLFYLFRLFELFLKDSFWAILLALFIFTSPVLAYYANNFLMDTTALAITFIAWYYFGSYYLNSKDKDLKLAMLFFLIAGLLKITSAISLVAIIIIFFTEIWGVIKFKSEGKIFIKRYRNLIPILTILVVLFAWYSYAAYYNNVHNRGVFLMTTLPIWDKSLSEIYAGLHVFFGGMMLPQFLNIESLIFIGIIFFVQLFMIKKTNHLFFFVTILLFLAVVSYLLLWFGVLPENHDYYLILPQIFVVFVLFSFFLFIKKYYSKLFSSPFIKIVFFLFFAINIYHASAKTAVKYFNTPTYDDYPTCYSKDNIDFINWLKNDFAITKSACRELTPYLRSLGITRYDKVVSIPDVSTNITLYYMDQKGFTDFGAPFPREREWFTQKIKNDGVKYLIVNDTTILSDFALLPFTQHLLGTYKNIKIFDLTKPIVQIEESYFFNFDSLQSIGNPQTIKDGFGYLKTKSCVLDNSNEYGAIFTFDSTNTKQGNYFKAIELKSKVLIKDSVNELMFVLQISDSSKKTLLWEKYLLEKKSDNWEEVKFNLDLKGYTLEGNRIEIFIWNKDRVRANFDDIQIKFSGFR